MHTENVFNIKECLQHTYRRKKKDIFVEAMFLITGKIKLSCVLIKHEINSTHVMSWVNVPHLEHFANEVRSIQQSKRTIENELEIKAITFNYNQIR